MARRPIQAVMDMAAAMLPVITGAPRLLLAAVAITMMAVAIGTGVVATGTGVVALLRHRMVVVAGMVVVVLRMVGEVAVHPLAGAGLHMAVGAVVRRMAAAEAAAIGTVEPV
jgi:hypothetical protein